MFYKIYNLYIGYLTFTIIYPMVSLPTKLPLKLTIHVNIYTVRPMDPLGLIQRLNFWALHQGDVETLPSAIQPTVNLWKLRAAN